MLTFYPTAKSYLEIRQAFPDYLAEVSETVKGIIQDVRARKNEAVRFYTAKFDKVTLKDFRVDPEIAGAAFENLSPELQDILLEAADNIRRFHQKQYPASFIDTDEDGTKLGQQFAPVQAVGVYIPGGTAAYPSSVLMNIIPAQIARVPRIVAISPPQHEGQIHPMVLATLGLLEIDEIYAIGGAQGIAALAYGTETIPRVYKITGPGNAYVMEAKRQVYGQVGIDSLAGPTEVVVIADENANPLFVARDLMAQAEHDVHAMSILISSSTGLIDAVNNQLEKLIKITERREIVEQAIQKHGAAILVSSLAEAVEVANEIAPEHLEILTQDAESFVKKVKNAGAIFWGEYSSEPIGDYWAGPNHVLPTNGTAKFSSPLGVLDFMKFSSLIHISKQRLLQDAHKIETFAKLEGLHNHAKSVEVRHE
ncbi:histidinol dehydrogenase [candidate division KSB1 bacterium]|nr:histidinol dehydrogenase [candidate division KSB1 bacterium]